MAMTKTFTYELIRRDGKHERGKITAESDSEAGRLLRQQGLVPISITESDLLHRDISLRRRRVKLKDLVLFSRQFATMIASGLTLLRSLAVLEEQSTNPVMKKAVREVRLNIEGGAPLSTALAEHPRVFPPLMIAMITAGETGGFLDEALDRIAGTLEKDALLRGKAKGALTYPAIVLSFTVVLVSILLIFIVPIFERMFEQFGGRLPLPTRIIVEASHAMVWAVPLLVVAGVGGTALFRRELRRRPALRLRFDTMRLRVPLLGPLVTKVAISRFARNLGTLLAIGIPIIRALDVVAETSGNAAIAAAMKDVQEAVRDGGSMSAPFTAHPVFPPMVGQMVKVGEESGRISQMLAKLADFYEQEVDSATQSLTAAIEPIMVLIMGVVVGAMVLCLYLPMFTIYKHIQGYE